MEITVSEMMQFVQGVEQYYNNAWTKLIIVGGLIVGAGAILLPILIQWWQKKQLKIESEIIKKDLKMKIDEMVKSKLEESIKEYENKFEVLEKAITETQERASGYIFHVQGNQDLSNKDFSNAIESFIESARCYISIRDDLNLQTVLNIILKNVLPKLSDYDVIENNEDIFQKLLSSLEEANLTRQYTTYIRKLKNAFKVAKKRLKLNNVKK